MTVTRIDYDAHRILRSVRDGMKERGITGATLSDAVRVLGARCTDSERVAIGE